MTNNNLRRAKSAYKAVRKGTDFKIDSPTELPTYIPDLLANLMHLCDRDGIDFEDSLRRGRDHYDAEKGNDDE